MLPRKLDHMAADYAALIRQIQPFGPYNLLGWSFGGLVAYSIATHFQSEGQKVRLLALLDSYPSDLKSPISPHNENLTEQESDTTKFLTSLLHEPHHSSTNVQDHLSPSLSQTLRKAIHILSFEPHLYHAAIIDGFKNSIHLANTFLPPSFYGDILLFVAGETQATAPMEAWKPHIKGLIRSYNIDCDHHEMLAPTSLSKIGAILTIELAKP